MKFQRIRVASIIAVFALFGGCQTTPTPNQPKPVKPSPAGEAEMKKLNVNGAKLGDPRSIVRRFGSAKKVTSPQPGLEVYEVYKPNQYISMLILTFRDNRLWKMELRYFNGPTERTIAATGGWDGLRDILI
jgi:hypothetical protein